MVRPRPMCLIDIPFCGVASASQLCHGIVNHRPCLPTLSAEMRWRVPPQSRVDVIVLQFQSHTPGRYDGYLHIKTNFDDMVIPVDISVIKGGLSAFPPSLEFETYSTDRVRRRWAC